MKFGCPEPSKKVFDFWNFCSSKRRLRLRLPLVHISMKLLLSTKSNNMEMMLMIMVMLMMPTMIIMVMMGMKINQIRISKQFILCQWYLNPEVIIQIACLESDSEHTPKSWMIYAGIYSSFHQQIQCHAEVSAAWVTVCSYAQNLRCLVYLKQN